MGLSLPIVIILTGLFLSGGAPAWVLPPTAEPAVRKFMTLNGGQLNGLTLSAKIEDQQVLIIGRTDSGEVSATVSMVHPAAAPEGATLVSDLAVVAPSTPASTALKSALLKRLAAHPLKLPWRSMAGGAETRQAEQRARDEAAQAALSHARYLKAIEDVSGAQQRLVDLPQDLSAGVRLEVALLQRKLGQVEASVQTARSIQTESPVDRIAISLLENVELAVLASVKGLSLIHISEPTRPY